MALIVILTMLLGTATAQCTFRLGPNPRNNPITIKNNNLIKANARGEATLQNNEQITILCSGNKNSITIPFNQTHPQLLSQTETAKCLGQLFIQNRAVPFEKIGCLKNAKSSAWDTLQTCNQNGKILKIGFQSPHVQISTITICFDPVLLTTYWTHHHIAHATTNCPNLPRKPFKPGDSFGTIDPEVVYSQLRDTQRGHLAPFCDFFIDAEKLSTFWFINAAPQNARFNIGNWKLLEGVVRKNVEGAGMMVYTGTHGVLRYAVPNSNQLPYPKYFWKIVVGPNGKGVAFVGINDVVNSYVAMCTDVCDQLDWLGSFQQQRTRRASGIVYCCEIEDFQRIVPSVKLPQTLVGYTGGLLETI